MQRVIITTGGTGGHIFPALAVAEELKAQYPDIAILFMGAQYGPEKKLALQAGLEFAGLPVRGLLGRGWRAAGAACAMVRAVVQACGIIRRFKPDIVAGFGGYAAFAPVMAARLCHVPCLLHEQNAIPGTANKTLARLTHKVCLSLPVAQGFAPEKCVLTGNPVRKSVAALYGTVAKSDTRHVLIMGGSLGAHALNMYIVSILPQLKAAGIELLHQTGVNDATAVQQAYVAAGYDAACVSPFIDDMAAAYRWADVVFCRSGATTVAELAAAGKAAIFVPFPYAIHDHQTYNARSMTQCGAAVLVPEKDLPQTDVVALLCDLFLHQEKIQAMAQAAHGQAHIDAAAAVVREIQLLVKGNNE
jgi:UDP-N-acetylglucosamine--N-acetylmuramyl-(pentapeptide) pyrophosphoryl-undecaprenol N-acetylglucosamine transferase